MCHIIQLNSNFTHLLYILYLFVYIKSGISGLDNTEVFTVDDHLDIVIISGGSSIVLSIITCEISVYNSSGVGYISIFFGIDSSTKMRSDV